MNTGSLRLAIRTEGQMVNAYVATTQDMNGALLIGSVSLGLLNMDNALFYGFKQLMTDALHVMVRAQGGKVLEVMEQPAPEHEKAGHA